MHPQGSRSTEQSPAGQTGQRSTVQRHEEARALQWSRASPQTTLEGWIEGLEGWIEGPAATEPLSL